MKIVGLKNRLKGSGAYVALAVCMIGIGACGWLTVGKRLSADKPASGQVYSHISGDTPSYNDTVDVGLTVSDVIPNNQSDNTPSESENTSSEAVSSETQNTVADYFVLPLTGEILKPFSLKEMQYSKTFADWRLHNALDIAGEDGATIRSAGDGMVADAYDDAQFGRVVKIDHGNGVITVYCGLNSVYVKKGEAVGINQDIGTLGAIPCESSDDIHLHFAVIRDGEYVSPLEIVNME